MFTLACVCLCPHSVMGMQRRRRVVRRRRKFVFVQREGRGGWRGGCSSSSSSRIPVTADRDPTKYFNNIQLQMCRGEASKNTLDWRRPTAFVGWCDDEKTNRASRHGSRLAGIPPLACSSYYFMVYLTMLTLTYRFTKCSKVGKSCFFFSPIFLSCTLDISLRSSYQQNLTSASCNSD